MTIQGWKQETVWLLGAKLPLGDPHDGQGHRPQLHGSADPQSPAGLLICDELHQVYFSNIQSNRITQRTWASLVNPQQKPGAHTQSRGAANTYFTETSHDKFADNPSYASLYTPRTIGDSTNDQPAAADLLLSDAHQYHINLYKSAPQHGPMCFEQDPRTLLFLTGVPAAIHWRRDETADLLVALCDGSILRWQGLDDPTLSPLPGIGEPVMAGRHAIEFEHQVHISVVDWNQRGRSDLLVATSQGELWLFYDDGSDDEVSYDQGRRLCDTNGPIQLLGAASATIIHHDGQRWLVAADGQGQLWQWPLTAVQSWLVNDWVDVSRIEASSHPVAREHQPGQWWVQQRDQAINGYEQSRQLLRLGPAVVDVDLESDEPVIFEPLPPELSVKPPCVGPCEIYVTLTHVLNSENDFALASAIDLRVGGQLLPRLVECENLAVGQSGEVYWGTADLTTSTLCLSGLLGGHDYQGGLPVAVVSIRVVPLTPQTHLAALLDHAAVQTNETTDQDTSSAAGSAAAKFSLEDAGQTHAADDALSDEPDDELAEDLEDDLEDELEEEPDDELANEPAREPLLLAGMIYSLGSTNHTAGADNAQQMQQYIGRMHDAGFGRLYANAGASPWQYPSQVAGARMTVGPQCSPEDEVVYRREAQRLEAVNRIELAAAASHRQGMELFASLTMHHTYDTYPAKAHATDQFTLDHPQLAEQDRQGKPIPGKLCLGYQAVRDFYISIVLELMAMDVDGVLLEMSDHLPMVSFGQPIVDEFTQRHHLDMRTLSPFDLRVVEMQSLVLTRFMRELRDRVHHARPRRRLPIHVSVAKPYALMGCDPATWARENLIDAILLTQPDRAYSSYRAASTVAMASAIEGTHCQVASVLEVESDASELKRPARLSHVSRHLAEQNSSFIVFEYAPHLIRSRHWCQSMAMINEPDTYQPRSVLG